ncbi:MAG TPA: hypothetical protein VNA24_21980, partial [Hyalangium sp.]|nr:hypothetical protein [Hyalangium sp.]
MTLMLPSRLAALASAALLFLPVASRAANQGGTPPKAPAAAPGAPAPAAAPAADAAPAAPKA